MTEYDLYLESGPQHRKTMVHVLGLLGCVANGPTTDEALAATPDAIRAYLRFLRRAGEDVEPDAPFTTRVTEHITEGIWIGNGSLYLTFAPDLDPISSADLTRFTNRFHALREALASWVETQPDDALDALPSSGGRSARAMLLHVIGTPGAYVSPAAGGTPGVSGLVTKAERGQLPLAEALRSVEQIVSQRLLQTTAAQRREAVQHGKVLRTLRKAIRRTLEHDWEHLIELSRRPGGPQL